MGLFDRFRKRVNEVVEETDTESITAEADSNEALEALNNKSEEVYEEVEQEWDELEDESPTHQTFDTEESNDDWEDLDDLEDEEIIISQALTRKEKKRLAREKKTILKATKAHKKAMKKRGAVDVARPKGSKVDLSMMRTTTA